MAWPATSARSKNWGTEVLTDTDLEGEFDLLHTYINDMMNSSSGHKHDGTTAEGPKLNLASSLTIASQATGDVFYASNASTIARLGIGTADQLLAVNSGATAPEWVAFSDYTTAANALSDSIVQEAYNKIQTTVSGSTVFVLDDTVPLSTEGNAISGLTTSFTANHASNLVNVRVSINCGGVDGNKMVALYDDGTCVATSIARFNSSDAGNLYLEYQAAAGDTNAHSWTVRFGSTTAGTIYLNASPAGAGNERFGDTLISSIKITEFKA